MTQEEKQLLLKDLSARLPYGVKYVRDAWNFEWDQEMSVVEVLEDIDKEGYINYHKIYKVEDIKPYLRPMSSMTEEEKEEYTSYCFEQPFLQKDKIPNLGSVPMCIGWLLEHHFDFNSLIEKGLAIEAPEGMYKIGE